MLRRNFLVLASAVGTISPPAKAEPKIHQVEIKSFAFVPSTIEIALGDTVRWTNLDYVPHTATADDKSWDTGLLKNGATGEFAPKMAGTIKYHCHYHPAMKATIVVV
jgi:plastocyanin